MAILGGGILKRAMAVVGSQEITLLRFVSRAQNAAGIDVPVYAAPVKFPAQVQPVPHAQFVYLGLDFQKDYVRVYASCFMGDLQRDKEADRFIYAGTLYELVSNDDWKRPQGFLDTLAVKIK